MSNQKIFSLLFLMLIAMTKTVATIPPQPQGAMGTYVGELHERWAFTSDHLPIGMSVDGIHIASWNVLDASYMDWVTEKDSQGLLRSKITEEHIPIAGTKLTLRDRHNIDLIVEMISHPTHPRSLVSLQECSEPFLAELRLRLQPIGFSAVSHHGEATLFDKARFELLDARAVAGIFSKDLKRTFQTLTLRRLDTGETIRCINVHLPGDPEEPARFEFANHLSDTFDSKTATIALGDMNFNEVEMADAMNRAFGGASPFLIHTPYCTNISPYTFISKAIDHFIVYTPKDQEFALSRPDQILQDLDRIAKLLSL